MASLIDELIATLESEKEIYEKLIPISESKTKVLIESNLEELHKITEEEQELSDQILVLEHKRQDVINNMGIVLNKEPESLNLVMISRLLSKQPDEKKQIDVLHDSLQKVARRLVDINTRNKSLIEQSLEMVEFNMNFIQSTRMSPGSNNYDRNAGTAESGDVYEAGSFDAKQ